MDIVWLEYIPGQQSKILKRKDENLKCFINMINDMALILNWVGIFNHLEGGD